MRCFRRREFGRSCLVGTLDFGLVVGGSEIDGGEEEGGRGLVD